NASSKSAPSLIFTIGSLKLLRRSNSPFTAQFANAAPCMPNQRKDSGCVSGKTTHAHDGGRHRNVRGLGKFLELRGRATRDNAAAAIKHRAFGLLAHPHDLVQREIVRAQIGLR